MVKFLFRIVEKSFEKHYPVQEEVIPLAVAGQNIIARAKMELDKQLLTQYPQ
jgi:hypothetical protein